VAIVAFYLALRADINIGVLTGIWSISPLYLALLDYLFFDVELTKRHMLGMMCLVLSVTSLAICTQVEPDPPYRSANIKLHPFPVPSWFPTLLAMLAPIGFSLSSILVKWLVGKRKLNATTLPICAYTVVNLVISIASVCYFLLSAFNWQAFLLGFISSIINTLGIICTVHAFSSGPIGPTSALINSGTILLVIVEGIRFLTVPRYLEVLSVLVGLLGGAILTMPREIQRVILCVD